MKIRSRVVILGAICVLSHPVFAYDITDNFSATGLAAVAFQCQILDPGAGADDECGAAAPFQPAFSFRPNDASEFFLGLGFAAGNALNESTPFAIAPWGADLEEDVQNINGRPWSYLLNAWYMHSFKFDETSSLAATVGIIDSTDFLDENAYANDEFEQFLNPVFINTGTDLLPSYDVGGGAVLEYSDLTLTGVAMNVGENDDGNNYTFFGVELGHDVKLDIGDGTYRLLFATTTDSFTAADGGPLTSRMQVSLSANQAVSENVGLFLRLAWQDQDAVVDYGAIFSGGVNLGGAMWGREDDNIGIGYAFLDDGSSGVENTHVAEIYYRAVFGEYFAVTLDAQYMSDDLSGATGPAGFILGMRGVFEY